MEKKEKYQWELVELLSKISINKKLLDSFLTDLFTPKEYEEMARRWQIVKKLDKGLSQREIAEDLNTSIATITRGSRELLDQKGGFQQVLDIIKKTNRR